MQPTAASQEKFSVQNINGINIYNRDDYNAWFENEYSSTHEPWAYSQRGAERYRHVYTVNQLKKHCPSPDLLLELGSSKGLMTERLMQFCKNIYASDVSATAMKACKKNCEAKPVPPACNMSYYVTTTPGLPFANDSFDVVTVCDGMEGWWFLDEKKKIALEDIHRVLKKGGIAVLTDFFTSDKIEEKFANYERIIRDSPLTVVDISYLYDRPWYLMESVAKKVRLQKVFRKMLSNITLAKYLHTGGKLLGQKMANHIVIIARKP